MVKMHRWESGHSAAPGREPVAAAQCDQITTVKNIKYQLLRLLLFSSSDLNSCPPLLLIV